MSDRNLKIAPNYMTGAASQTIEDWINHQVFTLSNEEFNSHTFPEITVTDDLRNTLNYILYSNDTKRSGLVRRSQTAQDLMNNTVANLYTHQTLERYIPQDTLGKIELWKGLRDKNLKNVMGTVTDIETITSKDAFGMEKTWIYNAAFSHIHTDGSIGQFKKNQFQNFFIGIYDPKEAAYLEEIADTVASKGVRALNEDQSIAFEYLSRLGASISDASDLINKSADDILLTNATKDQFATVNNFRRAYTGLLEKGILEGSIKREGGKISSTGQLSAGVARMVDNLAEIIANGDNSIVTGWNAGFDISHMVDTVRHTPGAEQRLIKTLQDLGVDISRLPENGDISVLTRRLLDPFRDVLLKGGNQVMRPFTQNVYGSNANKFVSGTEALKMENLSAAMALRPNLTNAEKLIYGQVHHNAGIDVKQEAAFFFSDIWDEPLNEFISMQQATTTPFNINQGIEGLLFQAQDSGSMDQIRRYNKNVFAVVEKSNGDLYMSSGFRYDKAADKMIYDSSFAPGAFAQDVTYQTMGVSYVGKDTELAKAIANGNPAMAGEDLIRLEYKPAFLTAQQQVSEVGMEKRYLYMTRNTMDSFFGQHMRLMGRVGQDGKYEFNEFAYEKAASTYVHTKDGIRNYKDNPFLALYDTNQQKFLDRAERSFSKRAISTNENAFLLKDIVEQGNFADQTDKMIQTQKAILAASEGKTGALDAILNGTKLPSTAQIVNKFSIENKTTNLLQFNPAWLANTAVIADTVERGSLFEQIHRSAIQILNDPSYQTLVGSEHYYNRNRMYQTLVATAMEQLEHVLNPDKYRDIGASTGKRINVAGKYYLNMAGFIRGYRPDNYVPGKYEDISKHWVDFTLDNPYFTVSKIQRMTGMSGAQLDNDRLTRKNMLAFIDYMATKSDLGKDERKLFQQILDDDVAHKVPFQLGLDINNVLQQLKGIGQNGWAPEPIHSQLQSVFTRLAMPASVVNTKTMNDVVQSMQYAAKSQARMLTGREEQYAQLKTQLREFMTGSELRKGRESYAKIIGGFSNTLGHTSQEILRLQQTAIENYANNLVESLRNTGVKISVGVDSVYASYAGGTAVDIGSLIPRLRANSGGALTWMLGEHQSRYTATTGLQLAKGQKLGLDVISMMDYYQQQMFGSKGQHARRMIQDTIAQQKDPLEMLRYIMKIPDEHYREYALSKGSPSFDVRNMLYADTSPILSDKNAIKKIIEEGDRRVLSDAQQEALGNLKKYYNAWGKTKPIAGLAEESALGILISSDDALINPTILNADVALNAGAKQPGSEQFRIAIGDPESFSEYINKPGKMLANQLDNAQYFKTGLSKQQQAILEAGKITDLHFGPRIATRSEAAIANVTENGIGLSNRVIVNGMEANDAVKAQIYDMLVQKYHDDKTIASVFGSRFMPHEGGGLISSRIVDVLPSSLQYQKVKWDPGKMYPDMEPGRIQDFLKRVELQFADAGNGAVEFQGYGRGLRLAQGQDAAWQFYSRYFNDVKDEIAKRDSILNVVYMTQTGNQIVDPETLKKTVEEKLRADGLSSWSQKEWLAAADSLYERTLVAQNIFDAGMYKIGADSEKHESQSMARAIGQYYHGTGQETWQKEEALLHDIFYGDEFNTVAKRLSGDFREGRTLTAQWYYDIANLKLDSPLFQNKGEAEKIRTMIRSKVGAYLGTDKQEDIEKAFFRMMDESRHRLTDDILGLTGASYFAKSADQLTGHGNLDQLLFATTDWLQQQMKKERGAIQMTVAMQKADLARAMEIISNTGALTDRSGRNLSYSIDPVTKQVIVETNEYYPDPKKLEQAFLYGGRTQAEASQEFKKVLSELRDVDKDGNLLSRQMELRFLIDYPGSDKFYSVSDRELVSYNNTLFDDALMGRLQKEMGEPEFKSLFGSYLDESGKVKKEYIGRSIWGDALDAHFRDTAFMTPRARDITVETIDENGKIKKEVYRNQKLLGDTLYDETRQYADDPYRTIKTKDLVGRLRAGQPGANISQEYADNMYQVASLQQAALYNANSLSEKALISDKGQSGTAQFFHKAHIGDIETLGTMPNKKLAGTNSIFKRNFLVDVTDNNLGLTSVALGFDQIALAGVDLEGEAQTEFQRKFTAAQNQYASLKTMDKTDPAFQRGVNKYRELLQEAVSLQKDYSEGNKIKTSLTAKLMKSDVAGSVNNEVQVFQTKTLDKSTLDFMSQRTFQGKSLADWYKQGRQVNFATIGLGDLETIGFTDAYFKEHGINKTEWLKKLQTEGIAGTAHRWPSDYWGSTMAVQIYLDPNAGPKRVAYDAITAAFLKADSDGDKAQLSMNMTRNAKGEFVDALSSNMGSQKADAITTRRFKELEQAHGRKMSAQIYDTNAMVKEMTDYHEAYTQMFNQYKTGLQNGTIVDPLAQLHGEMRMDLSGRIMPFNNELASKQQIRDQYRAGFTKYRDQISQAIEQIGDTQTLERFKTAGSAEEAAAVLQARIGENSSFQDALYKALGNNADTINQAFIDVSRLNDGQAMMLQRVLRKGVGLADTPFTSIEFLRQNALALNRSVLTNSQNIAIDMVRELTKEPLLTPKKTDIESVYNATKNLDTLTSLLEDIFQGRKNSTELENRFTDFFEQVSRDPNSRYKASPILQDFVTDGKLDRRKIAKHFVSGVRASSEALRKDTDMFNLVGNSLMSASRGFKGRISMLQSPSKTQSGAVNRAIAGSNGLEEAYQRIARMEIDNADIVERGRKELVKRGALEKNIVEKAVRDFRPSKSLALSALTLAGAAVFGGYAGGNPAQPAQQQAQNIQEQNPPPRNINLTDPSLTASNRKQAGYVININAQTQKDKEYASRLITQAVTKNFQDTNVNVSMNVNQQPGNISGNDLIDYLSQALN